MAVHTNGRFREAQSRSGLIRGGRWVSMPCRRPEATGTSLTELCFRVRPIVIVSAACAAHMRPEARLSFVLNPHPGFKLIWRLERHQPGALTHWSVIKATKVKLVGAMVI